MTKTPPDSPAVSSREENAARTLAEHLPQGYTADFVPEDQQQTATGSSAPYADKDRPAAGGRNPSGDSGASGGASEPHLNTPSLAPAASTLASIRSGRDEAEGEAGAEQREEISSLHLQGGDVHRSLFRMAEAPARMQVLQSQPLLTPSPLSLSTTASPAQDHASASQPSQRPPQQQQQPQAQQQSQQQSQQPSAGPAQLPNRPLHRRAATFHDRYTPSEVSSVTGGPNGDGSEHGSEHGGYDDRDGPQMQVRDLLAPQGFRRDFVLQQIRQRQLQEREATMQRRRTHLRERRASAFRAVKMPIARNFVEFLELYGHFADEDLEASDDDEDDGGAEEQIEEEYEEVEEEEEGEGRGGTEDVERGMGAGGGLRRRPHERQPLLGRRTSGAVVASASSDAAGDGSGKAKAGLSQAFFTLLKAFVGTGIMFLPKAFNNGGMVFSTVTLLIVSMLSMGGFELLLRCRQRYGGGYGDIGLAIAGPRMRSLILGSIALSQLGFVCAGIVFAAENLASFASAVAHAHTRRNPLDGGGEGGVDDSVLSTNAFIALEVAVLIPLGFVRDIARLGPAALLGDVFIAIGLVYMYTYDVAAIAARGWRMHETVDLWFNPSGYALTIGAAIFTFEGIGLILPIQSSMARPERFRWLLGVVMAIITAAYISVGALGYAAFGTGTKTEVIDNYPRASALVQTVQCLYAIAVLAGMPVQLFPAVRIIDGRLFRTKSSSGNGAVYYRSGKRDPRIKWAKNALRTALTVACGAVAVLGAGHLDRFVALIGSLACVPLLFIYPPYLHYRGMADESSALLRVLDIALMAVGTVAMIYTTIVTVQGGL
ncbi:solute carrier family 36 (proton-coupled amino acid transporter) [Sporothrix schenckii 1099-18]|uniref:Amino acid transporter transmembrane domain-containing protein n=2 Tax=Sporothrix schenckii TaxID=29908 RepID=U7PS75_SPOS1|nr:solute carrier family 36 (proton-coupled amino acid transporter) [Sporothrix schenckii 1099-18]ERS97806.1 hypothetical protein HMPREF1624_05977 [Sporothrix schenckii ATCC 58251]KJR82363.1 solute carrier family 36 (proton-coupled amino acid transporter) [Sporothrix schenckii 1099-18]